MAQYDKVSDLKKMSEDAMYEYIQETPKVLQNILDGRKEYTKDFVANFVENKYEKVILIGSGTSYHGSLSTRAFIERTLKVPVDANYPLLYMNFNSVFNQKTLVIGTSQGGESKSTIQGLDYSRANGCFTVSLTEQGAESKVAQHSDMALKFNCGEKEYAGPKTKGYQAQMLNLILLALETGLALETITEEYYNSVIDRIQKTINNLDNVIKSSVEWYNRNREEFKIGKRMIVIGYGNNYGNVLEGRLKIEEAVRYGIEGYELEEFFHGIYHSIDEGVHIVYVAQKGQFQDRAVALRNFMKDYTPHEFMIGNLESDNPQDLSIDFVDDPEFCIFEYIIPLQIIAFFCSKDLGINANIPKIVGFHYIMGSK